MRCPDRRWIGDGTLRIGLTLTVVLVGGDGGSLDGPLIFSGRSSRGKSLSDALFARPRYRGEASKGEQGCSFERRTSGAERVCVDRVVGSAKLLVDELGRGGGFATVAACNGESCLTKGEKGCVEKMASDSTIPVFHEDAGTGDQVMV